VSYPTSPTPQQIVEIILAAGGDFDLCLQAGAQRSAE
jgi:hypothetical protein